ncbi:Bifunctional protein GlmU [Geodia barretti]|nr:Bifunctional protein GlmU [Geodia barretti]
MLSGNTNIGEECQIGPNSVIQDTHIGDRCRVLASFLEGAHVASDVSIGPYCHLRPDTSIANGVHLGNFVEVKNSHVGANTAAGHFCYLGDADIGAGANIGAGTVTCNFDGVEKHRTAVGDGAFIGSDTMLVAPVSVGRGAATGAGSVVTKDVPAGRRAVGVPARLIPNVE